MDGLAWYLIVGVLFYLMMRGGCGSHRVHGHGHGGHSDHGSHDSQRGEQRDPVCGMSVASDQGYGKMHAGTLYRFCSRNCLDKFEASPDKYLKPATAVQGGAP